MKNITSILKNTPKRAFATFAILATAVVVPATVFAWGPSRDTFTTANPADHITFNSITDNPAHGDERNFAQVKESTASNSTYVDSIEVAAGKTYTVFVYYHNNAAANLNLVAKDSYVKVALPAVVTKGNDGTKAVAYVGASNASPKEVWDDVTFVNKTNGDMALRYIDGSAKIHNFGSTDGAKLSDNIITSGATIGYNSLNGDIPGCNEYAGYVTFDVTADQPNFTVDKQVRKSGSTTWTGLDSVSVVTGDSVDYLITYKNNGTTTQNDVVVKDVLPTGVEFTNGTTYIVNDANKSGLKISDNIVSTSGINIGNYAPGAAAYVKFSAKITAKTESLACGVNTIVNTARVETNNGSKSDTANVTMTKACSTAQLPVTGIGEDIAAIFGIGSLATSAAYYISSRRAKFNQ